MKKKKREKIEHEKQRLQFEEELKFEETKFEDGGGMFEVSYQR